MRPPQDLHLRKIMADRKNLSKSMLLPGTAASTQERILRNHIALAALLAGKGNGYQLATLIETAFLAWFLLEDDIGSTRREEFLKIEQMIAGATRDLELNLYTIREDDREHAAWLINFHEQQLKRAPIFKVRQAWKRLAHFARSGRKSPWEPPMT